MKHSGSLDDLKTIVQACGFLIDDVVDQENSKQIRTKQGAIINWYPSTGTVLTQGNKEAKQRFTAAWDSYTGGVPSTPSSDIGPAPVWRPRLAVGVIGELPLTDRLDQLIMGTPSGCRQN